MQTVNIEFYRDENPAVNDAYDRLISKIPLLRRTKGYNLFTITGCEPKVGSTTIAISIAVSLASSGWSTLLVDSDIRKGPYKKRLNESIDHGLSDLLRGDIDIHSAVCQTNIDKLRYMSCGGESDNPVVLLNSEAMNSFIKTVSEEYHYVIFDSPSLNAAVDAAILTSKTSGAILIAGYMKTKRAKIEAAVRELEQIGANTVGIVLNNIAKKDYKRYIENYDYFTKNLRGRSGFIEKKRPG